MSAPRWFARLSAEGRVRLKHAPSAGFLLALALIWEAYARWGPTPKWILPGPLEILRAGVEAAPLMWPHIWQSLLETWAGLALAIVGGVLLAIVLDLSAWLRRALYPLLVISQTVPILALAPLLIIWFGYGMLPKAIVVFLVCFFPIAVNTTDGLGGTDSDMIALFRSMGASRWQVFARLRLPSALPAFFTGLKVAVTYGLVGAIIGEWVGASKGLGVFMIRASNSFLTARVFAAIGVTAALSVGMFLVVAALERAVLPWHYRESSQEQWEEMR